MTISKRTALVTLVITALVGSRALFAFFDDPEGPNLLVVLVTAAVIFGVSSVVYKFCSTVSDLRRMLLAISSQVALIAMLYLLGS
ncbi:MAG TPA: hypothetical protein VFS75_02070 [Candidatus Paceibacterota bacterium]|nr:hypothetical protein [Candidatus Paceibacterota bacterium]